MRKLHLSCVIILLLTLLISPAEAASSLSKEALRKAYLSISYKIPSALYVNEPSTINPYSAGKLSAEAADAALERVNFIRMLAGLTPVEADPALNDLAQHGAVLTAANGVPSHSPEKPAGMDERFYELGCTAAAGSNLVSFNWTEPEILTRAVEHFTRDDGEANRLILGHRRWMLYPGLRYVGFGLAQDGEGRSYAAMYVMDDSGEADSYDMIAWPSAGAFPAEYMTKDTSWSVSFNPRRYDLAASAPRITMTERTTGASYTFDNMEETASEDQYFVLGGGRYGDGPAYIFRPDLSQRDELMYGYQQNQVWEVSIDGMISSDGTPAGVIEYTVEMASLTPIDPAAVEISVSELTLKQGQTAALSASVIPDWADDLTIAWSSSDAEIAVIDETGTVTAKKAGKCRVTAQSVNGRYEEIEVTVVD